MYSRTIIKCLRFLFLILPILALSACSQPAKTESEVIEDLQNAPSFFPAQDITIEDYEILKRQTSPEDKTDFVYITVDATNDNIDCRLSYCMTYALYNEGWILESVNPYMDGEWEIVPLTAPVPTEADSVLSETYDEFRCEMQSTPEKKDGFYYCFFDYIATKNYPYMEQNDSISLAYIFDTNSVSWIYNGFTVSNSIEKWSLNGIWQSEIYFTGNPFHEYGYWEVNISDYDGYTLTGDVSFYTSSTQGGQFSLTGSISGNIVPYDDEYPRVFRFSFEDIIGMPGFGVGPFGISQLSGEEFDKVA